MRAAEVEGLFRRDSVFSVVRPVLSGCANGHKQFVYVTGQGTNEAFEFRVQNNGALVPLGAPNFPVGSNPAALKPHTSGDFLYVADFSGNDVPPAGHQPEHRQSFRAGQHQHC